MADIDAVFNDDDFFTEIDKPVAKDKTPKPKWIPIASGEYLGHICDVEEREVATHKGEHKATVYNYKVKVATENSENTYTYKWGNTEYDAEGSEYVGQTIRGRGVFKFLVPTKGDTFKANPEGNKTYTYFCDAIGIDLPIVEKEINGETVRVKTLPTLTKEHISGVPVVAVVSDGKPYTNKNGKEVTPKIVKYVKAWKGGTKMETTNEAEIPF